MTITSLFNTILQIDRNFKIKKYITYTTKYFPLLSNLTFVFEAIEVFVQELKYRLGNKQIKIIL